MNSNTVDLIATDPPFNKGRDFHATPDSIAGDASFQDRWSWEKDVHPEWVDQITDDDPHVMNVIEGSRLSYGDDMGAFLCFMGVRLMAMKRVLKDTGSIYLHCDPTASHYLKELMDAVFHKKNFLNEIIWYYRGAGTPKDRRAKRHDVIFWYGKRFKKHYFNPDGIRREYAEATKERFRHKIGNVRNGIDFGDQALNPLGKHPDDVITDIQPIAPSANARTGYPTQKPVELLEDFIKSASKKNDIVLDPFAGCATTCVAAEKLGRQWVGIDIWDKAHEIVVDRLKKECYLEAEDKEREDLIFSEGSITYSSDPPSRTDDGEISAPYLRVKERMHEPEGKKMSRAEMMEHLLRQDGCKCKGCNRTFDDPRYLELDHNTPRADGGINHITNRILLCGPCNKLKGHLLTLSGLQRENKKRGHLK